MTEPLARVVQLRSHLAVVGAGTPRAHATLQPQAIGQACRHRQVDAVPVLDALAVVVGKGHVVVHLPDLGWIEIVEVADLVTAAVRQPRIERRRDAVVIVIAR